MGEKMKKLLRVDEAAEILAVDPRTVYRECAEGRLSALRVRNALRIPAAALNAYIRRRMEEFSEENGTPLDPDVLASFGVSDADGNLKSKTMEV